VRGCATTAHFRLNLLGSPGLTILGAPYQFYPPAVGQFRGGSDRTAFAPLGLLAGGLAVQVPGLALGSWLALAGELLATVPALPPWLPSWQ
jgi:hypothetical protein